MSLEAYTYEGAWINWSRGPVLGATITLSSRNGAFLLAVLALFVGTAGSRCWRIIAFIYHQAMVRQEPRDGMHHQHRVIMRSSSASGALLELLEVAYSWRSRARLPFARSIPLILLAVLNPVGFIVAGVFSSQITAAVGDEVLIQGPNCGFWGFDVVPKSVAERRSFTEFENNSSVLAANYARFCYDVSADGNAFCNGSGLPRLRINWTAYPDGDCPFSPGVCINTTKTYTLDTGHIDSHDGLGMNAGPRDRITFRKVTSCAIIRQHPFARYVNATKDDGSPPGQVYLQLYYGPSTGFPYTYQFATLVGGGSGDYGYSLRTFHIGTDGQQTWHPISNLSRTDADINLLFLAPNILQYQEPNNDLYFLATTPWIFPLDNGFGSNRTYYQSDYAVSAIGCTEQYQFCNPNLLKDTKCTSLTGQFPAFDEVANLNLNHLQLGTAIRLSTLMASTSLRGAIWGRGVAALRAQDTVVHNVQGKIPDDQWTKEIQGWFATGLARLQLGVVGYATGPANTNHTGLRKKELSVAESEMCLSQKVRRRDGSISFSTLGLAIVFAVGGAIIVTSVVLEPLVGRIRRFFKKGEYLQDQWQLDEKLQLQRLAYEGARMGNWEGDLGSIPVTQKGDVFQSAWTPKNGYSTLSRLN